MFVSYVKVSFNTQTQYKLKLGDKVWEMNEYVFSTWDTQCLNTITSVYIKAIARKLIVTF